MSENKSGDSERAPPLNLTEKEVAYLWDMMMEEVGKESVQHGPNRDVAESLHSKVRKARYSVKDGNSSTDSDQ